MLFRSAAISRDLCRPLSSVKNARAAKAFSSLSLSSAHQRSVYEMPPCLPGNGKTKS